jgi:hypothetical protein
VPAHSSSGTRLLLLPFPWPAAHCLLPQGPAQT